MLKRTRIQEPPHVGDFTVQQVEAKIAALKKAKFVVDKEIAVLDDAISQVTTLKKRVPLGARN